MSRRFVMSDVHGNYKGLKQCLQKVDFDYIKDTLIFNGDVCDGYPEVDKCIKEMMCMKHCYTTVGNHDLWAMDWIKSDFTWRASLWTKQGGEGTINSYKDYPKGQMPKTHIDWLFNMRKYISYDEPDGQIVFVHGGLNPNQRDLDKQDMVTLAWDRELMRSAWFKHQKNPKYKFAGKKKIFIGHTTTQMFGVTRPLFLCNVVCGDTGGGWDGPLTIIDIDTLKWEQSDPAPELYPNFKPRF